jgi:hypothetical protein
MPAGPSPPCASLGELLGDEAASTAGNRKRRQKPRVRVPVADAHGGKAALTRVAAGRRSRGRRTAYKGPGTRPWRAGHAGGACGSRTPRRRRGRVRVGDDPSSGMTSGTHGSATQGAGGGSGCGDKWLGLGRKLKRLLALGGCGAGLQGG